MRKLKLRQLTAREQKILFWVALPLFYLFCLLIFVRLTFPYQTLKERLLTEFNSSQRERVLEVDSLGGSGLFGVEFEGVLLENAVTDKESEGPPPSLRVETLDVSVSLLSYLFGAISVDFDAEMGGGEIEGDFYQNDTQAELEVEGENVDISGLSMLGTAVGLPLGGVLGGQVQLLLPERQIGQAVGRFDLTIDNLTVGDGKAKIRDTIALPKLSAGPLVLQGEVTDGRLEITEFGCNGPDFEMTGSGKVRLREAFDKSVADLEIAFRFKEAYQTKNEMTKSLFGDPGSKVPGLFDMDPKVRRAKGEDGFYRWRVTGLLGNLSFRPAAGGAGSRPQGLRPKQQ